MRLPLWITVLLTAAALAVCLPLAPWIALAVWLGLYARRFHAKLAIRLGGRLGLAATLTVGLLLVVAVPIVLVLTSIVLDAIALVRQLYATPESRAVLVKLVEADPRPPSDQAMQEIGGAIDLLISQGDRAWAIGRELAGAAAHFVIGLLVMVTGIYGVLVNGGAWYAWLGRHTPLSNGLLDRFSAAFVETGRGLWFGIVGAGMLQSAIATLAYLIIGVPSALALGMLTLLLSVVPAVGTALVWAPVAAGLALTGRPVAALVLAAIGIFVISTVDNLARPWLARKGQLQLPTWVVLISMFGGVEVIGAWGLLLGPLIVRLAKEALLIAKGDPPEHETATSDEPVTPPPSS